MTMSIATAPTENRPMIHLKTGPLLFERISELIDIDKPVEVYRNLHKKCWSVRQGGKVRLHTDYICLEKAELKVLQKGRERVLKEQSKNVHAFIKGFLVHPNVINGFEKLNNHTWIDVGYNPYKCGSFVTGSGREVKSAKYVDMCTDVENPVMIIEEGK